MFFWSVSRRKEEVGPQSTEAQQAVASLTLWATAPPTSSAALPSPLLWRASIVNTCFNDPELGKGCCNRWSENTGIVKKGGGGSDRAKIEAN